MLRPGLLSLIVLVACALRVFGAGQAVELDLRRETSWSTGLNSGIHSMLLQGDRLYVCQQPDGLVIVDVSQPEAPQKLGVFNSPGMAIGVAVVGNTAYLGDEAKGLQVLDITDPAQPKFVGKFSAVSRSFRVAVRDQYVFLTDPDRGLLVLDASNLAAPIKVSEISTGGGASDVALAGDFAFLASGSKGVSVVNIHDPANPLLVTNVNLASGSVGTVSLNGNTLYGSSTGGGLMVVDVSEPTTPLLVTNLTAGISGYGVAHANGLVGLADNSGFFQLWQVLAPATPVPVGKFPVTSPTAVAMDSLHAFVANGSGKIDVFALDEPARPASMAKLPLGDSDVRPLFAGAPGALHLARGTSLTTFDTSHPSSLTPTKTNTLSPFGPSRISFSGNLALGLKSSFWLWALNLADPLAPEVVGALSTAPSLQDLVVEGNRGFGGGANHLDWLDLSNPAQPAFVASLTNSEVYRFLAVRTNHLYAITQAPALQVFDVSVPQVFTLLTNLPLEGVGEVVIAGNRLYLNRSRLVVYSLDDPANPVRLGTYTNALQYRRIVVHDDFLYGQIAPASGGSSSGGGFEVLDVSDAAAIHRVGGNCMPITSIATEGSALFATTATELVTFPLLQRTLAFQLKTPELNGTQLMLKLQGVVGRTVTLEKSSPLGAWQTWRSVSFSQETLSIDDEIGESTTFYRIVEP